MLPSLCGARTINNCVTYSQDLHFSSLFLYLFVQMTVCVSITQIPYLYRCLCKKLTCVLIFVVYGLVLTFETLARLILNIAYLVNKDNMTSYSYVWFLITIYFARNYLILPFSCEEKLIAQWWLQDSDDIEIDGDVLHSESEKTRRQKFEAILKLQQESSGLIEPKKDEVLLPGMFLPQSVPSPSTESDMISSESQSKDPVVKSHKNPGSSFNGTGSRKNKNPNMRKHRSQNSGKQVRHWIRKDTASEN